MSIQKKSFQLDIRLGLALIVLVLLVLLFATNYTLYRIKASLKAIMIEELHTTALYTANSLDNSPDLANQDSILFAVQYEYDLTDISLLSLDYNRVTSIQMGEPLDDQLRSLDHVLTADDLKPLLKNEFIFRHELGESFGCLLFPLQMAGSKYILSLEKENLLLGSVEKAGALLVYCAILGTLVIIYASFKFARRIISPFENLKEKAVRSGRYSEQSDDDVGQMIQSYEAIINDLKSNELELAKLNSIILAKAEHLEVYNNYILNSINTGIVTLDVNRIISTVNPTICKMFDLPSDGCQDKEYAEIMAPFPAIKDFIDRFFVLEENIENDIIEIKTERLNKILSVSMAPLFDKDSHKIGYLIIFLDQTEFINLERELAIKERMAALGEMSGGLAHQLRNSIGGMIGFARLIEKKNENEAARKNIEALLKETGEAERLVSRFLDFARPLEPQVTPVHIRDMIGYLMEMITESHPEIKISVEYDETIDEINVDALLLKQALANIVNNAIDSINHDNGEVTVRSERSDRDLQIVIEDNGSGIPDNFRDKIFTPFFSGSPSGTGLGLPLVRKIILLHEGRIRFESDDRGTRFYITIPHCIANQMVALTESNPS